MKTENKKYTMELNYEKDTSIDDSALDVEWLDQPKLTMKYTRLEAKARKELDEAKARLDIIKAELDQDIRSDPDAFGLPKITEGAIQNAISVSKKCKDAEADVREASFELNMTQAAVRSIYAKKDALENLVRLHGQQYFAGPQVPRDLSKEWERRENQRQSNTKVKIQRRKK